MFDIELRGQTDIESELHKIDGFSNNKIILNFTRDAHEKYKRPPSQSCNASWETLK